MAGQPTTFSLESVRDFMISKGGKVTNHELVKHFKAALTNPGSQNEARNQFKEIVNTLATITRNEEGEKHLALRKKHRLAAPAGSSKQSSLNPSLNDSRCSSATPDVSLSGIEAMDTREDRDVSDNASFTQRQVLEPPPYKPPPPPPPSDTASQHSSEDSVFYDCRESQAPDVPGVVDPPPVPPRRKSGDKVRGLDNKENEEVRRPKPITADPEAYEALVEDNKISVKECTLIFNKMALESNLNNKVLMPKKRSDKANAEREDDDSSTGTPLDARGREWLIRCAQANYQAIAKLASENPKLVRLKDPTNGYSALHWAAKHGNENVVKLIAGTHNADVNARTNGGYTPLHIAMQFGHKEIFRLLVEVYNADYNLRDWSGKVPEQYLPNKEISSSVETMRKIKAKKKHAAEKDLRFLRMGSLNVRVKRTTEAFSNFLGVGNADKLHKNWGSADNIPQSDSKKMPPPKMAPIKKRKSKRAADFIASRINTPDSGTSNQANMEPGQNTQDSDSDNSAVTGKTWQSTV